MAINGTAGALQLQQQTGQQQNQLQLDQISGVLNLLLGNGRTGLDGTSGALSSLTSGTGKGQQTLAEARTQGIQDTQGLTQAALFDFNSSILPQLTGAAEGAGASANALTALLAQNAAAAGAGQVAKLQGNQILGQEQIAQQGLTSQQNNQYSLINGLLNSLLNQRVSSVGGNSGGAINTGGGFTNTAGIFDMQGGGPSVGPRSAPSSSSSSAGRTTSSLSSADAVKQHVRNLGR